MTQSYTTTGSLPFRGHRTWYGIVGDGEEPGRLPLLVLHGGPGVPHDALEPLAGLANGRRVVFYDQLGCGRPTTRTTRRCGRSSCSRPSWARCAPRSAWTVVTCSASPGEGRWRWPTSPPAPRASPA